MEDQKIISILKQSRFIKPNKKWEEVARDTMLVYTASPVKKKTSIFGILTSYTRVPYIAVGCMLLLVIGSISLTSFNTGEQREGESTLIQTTQQEQTENKEQETEPKTITQQEVVSVLSQEYEDTPLLSDIQELPLIDIQASSYENTIRRTFEGYLQALEEIDETEQDITVLQEKADDFVDAIQTNETEQEGSFEYALRIAVLHRANQCIKETEKETIQEFLNQNTIEHLIEANTLSIQCIKKDIALHT